MPRLSNFLFPLQSSKTSYHCFFRLTLQQGSTSTIKDLFLTCSLFYILKKKSGGKQTSLIATNISLKKKISKQPPSWYITFVLRTPIFLRLSRLHRDLHNKSSYLTAHLENLVYPLPSFYYIFFTRMVSLSLATIPIQVLKVCGMLTVLFYTCQKSSKWFNNTFSELFLQQAILKTMPKNPVIEHIQCFYGSLHYQALI